eukprot:6826666-Prorocentrum_lima.AAC.1
MTSSLVGSEMCIRDRAMCYVYAACFKQPPSAAGSRRKKQAAVVICEPVSYTHLTLPTICSV